MHLTPNSIFLLLVSGTLAGVLNAIAGGGTLVTFPILVLLGMNSIIANATSTVALIVGILGSIWGYRHQLIATLPWLRLLLPISILGGLLGSILLTFTPVHIFDFLVPYLILSATLLFMMRNFFVRQLLGEMKVPHSQKIAGFFQFFISLYGGYFGAGIGILMLASLGLMGMNNLIEMNALKTVLGGAINLVAAIYFIYQGLIDWPVALIIAIGALPGYYLGAILVQRIPTTTARFLIIAIGLILTVVTLLQQIRNHT